MTADGERARARDLGVVVGALLFMAETTTGFRRHVRHAVPLEAVRRLLGSQPHGRYGIGAV